MDCWFYYCSLVIGRAKGFCLLLFDSGNNGFPAAEEYRGEVDVEFLSKGQAEWLTVSSRTGLIDGLDNLSVDVGISVVSMSVRFCVSTEGPLRTIPSRKSLTYCASYQLETRNKYLRREHKRRRGYL
jgi:hypothetical protein